VDCSYVELCQACWAEPERRPSAQQVYAALDELALRLLGRKLPAGSEGQAPLAAMPAV
jgi:hypothetical protein